MSTTATETIIEFNKFYKYVWLRNFGDGDAYVSNKPNIVVGDDNVIFLPQGQMVMVQALTNKVYVLGETKIEAHAQEFADPPFGGDGASGGGGSAVLITKSVIQNGVYNASSDNADGYKTVNVSVSPNVDSKNITQNGTYTASSENLDGYSSVSVDVPIDAKSSTITQNGTYTASTDDLAGYSSVTVNVAQDVELMTSAQWNVLTTAQKQAKGLVGIQDSQSGFNRGILVNGADYIAAQYLPYSDSTFLFCEATKDNFDASENTWGSGEHPAIYKSNEHKPSYNSAEDAVYVNSASDNDVVPYVDLTYPQHPFTAYAVLKLVSPSSQSRVLCAFAARDNSQGIGLRGSPIYVAAWGDDTDTGITCSDYVVVAIRLTAADTTDGASGFVYDAANDDVIQIDKSPVNCGRYVAVCNADKFGSGYLGEQANGYVKYFGVIGTSESDATVEANMRSLYNTFLAE